MQKLFDRVTDRLRAFLYQRQYLALIVRSMDGEMPAIMKILETLEEESEFALFWQFPEAFVNADEYVQLVVESFQSKFELVRLLQQQQSMDVWPELPAEVLDGARRPVDRLQNLMIFARSLVPSLNGGLLVWVLFPSEVIDSASYTQFVRQLIQHQWPNPWCHHMRIIIRRDPTGTIDDRALYDGVGADWFEPDLSVSAINKALEEDVDDESLPLEERLQSLLLTAGNDQAHGRLDLAREKYQLLFDFYSGEGNLPMSAVALNGMGEVQRQSGNRGDAGASFEAALVAAAQGAEQSMPILLNIFLNLGNLRMEETRWADAESYYECAQRLATVLRYADTKIMILEQLGLAQSKQNKQSDALHTWQAGAILSKRLNKQDLYEKHLSFLRQHFVASGDPNGMRTMMTQLSQFERAAEN